MAFTPFLNGIAIKKEKRKKCGFPSDKNYRLLYLLIDITTNSWPPYCLMTSASGNFTLCPMGTKSKMQSREIKFLSQNQKVSKPLERKIFPTQELILPRNN